MLDRVQKTSMLGIIAVLGKELFFFFYSAGIPSKFTKMIPNGYLIFEDESFLDSTVAKMNALRKSGQFCDVRLQVRLMQTHMGQCTFSEKPLSWTVRFTVGDKMINMFVENTKWFEMHNMLVQSVGLNVCV